MGKVQTTGGDIDQLFFTQITNHIFEKLNAVAGKDQRARLNLQYELLSLNEPPMGILFLITKDYRLLCHVKGLMANGYGKTELASKAGIHPFAAGRYMDAAKRYELGELRTVMEEGAQLEQNVKTGLMTDTLAVELFIVKNSGKQ